MTILSIALHLALSAAASLNPDSAYALTFRGHDMVCFTPSQPARQSWAIECFDLGENWQ